MNRTNAAPFISAMLPRFLYALVALGLALYAALTVWLVFSGMFFPYALDYGEGFVLWFTHLLANGQPIYNLPETAHITSNYPPVFMLLAAPYDALFGVTYVWGRWLSFAAAALLVAFIIRIVRGETRHWRAALLAGFFFFSSTFVYHWAPLFRVDMLGVTFSIAGVFCVWRWERINNQLSVSGHQSSVISGQSSVASRQPPTSIRQSLVSRLYLPLAFGFFLLALYTKHSLFFAPAASILAIFLRDRRAAVWFALALGISGGAIFLLLEMTTRGGWSFGVLASNATVWTMRVFAPLFQSFIVTYAVLLALGALGWARRVLRERKRGVLEIYAVAACLSIALAGREGAWENYFLEPIALACLFTGFALAHWQSAPRWKWALPALLLLQLALFWDQHDPRIAQKLFDDARAGNAHVAPLVRAAQGDLISEDAGLLATNGKRVVYYSFPYSTLARAGKWDQHWELGNLRAGKFPLVILMQGTRTDVDKFGNFTRAFVSALDYGYAVLTEDIRYQVFAPAPLQNLGPNAQFGELFDLVGWSLAPEELGAEKTMQVTLVWRALQKPDARYTGFAHLEDANGGVIAQDDHEPKNGAYPTTRWAQEEMARDTFRLKIPANLKPGEYVLRVGWYDAATQDRLSLPDGADSVELEKFVAR